MASSSAAMSEKLQCSICLDVFNDPVSTPCGHNFCKICLNTYWDINQDFSCPNCKETFKQRPELKINTTLRDFVDEYKKKTSKNQPDSAFLCDICDEVKLKAVKSCLMCQSSYCQTHLEPHMRVKGLQKHKLIDPVNNLEDYICKKHEKPLEFFCRDDQTSVCLSCTDGDHKNHNTVTLEEESKEKKIELVKTQTDMQQKIQDRIKKIKDIEDSAELRRRNTQKQKEESVEIFRDLIQSIEKHQSELLKMMEEKEKSAEEHDEDLIKDLEQEITELKRRNIELKKISNTEDHLHLIQIHSSVSSLLNIQNRSEISMMSHVILDEIRSSFNQLQKTLHEKLNGAELKWKQLYEEETRKQRKEREMKQLEEKMKQYKEREMKQLEEKMKQYKEWRKYFEEEMKKLDEEEMKKLDEETRKQCEEIQKRLDEASNTGLIPQFEERMKRREERMKRRDEWMKRREELRKQHEERMKRREELMKQHEELRKQHEERIKRREELRQCSPS